MNTIELAIAAFVTAIEEARVMGPRGSVEVAELLRHARDLLDIVEEELAALTDFATDELEALARAMRERLIAVEGALITRH